MAARTWIFNGFPEMEADGTNDFSVHSYYAALMDSGYSPDIDAHEGWGDVSADEVGVVTGYAAGGQALQNITITRYDLTDRTVVTWDQLRWDLPDGLAGIKGIMVYNSSLAGKNLVAFFETASVIDVAMNSAYVAQPVIWFANGGA
jgi:hypothetical protein